MATVPQITQLLAAIQTWKDQHEDAASRPDAAYYAGALQLLDQAADALSSLRRSIVATGRVSHRPK